MTAPQTAETLDALHKIDTKLEALDADRDAVITAARRAGATWTQIGEALGTTKQSAWERYRHLDAPKEETV